MPTMGRLRRTFPVAPRKLAPPKVNTPPSAPTRRYPRLATPTTGTLWVPFGPVTNRVAVYSPSDGGEKPKAAWQDCPTDRLQLAAFMEKTPFPPEREILTFIASPDAHTWTEPTWELPGGAETLTDVSVMPTGRWGTTLAHVKYGVSRVSPPTSTWATDSPACPAERTPTPIKLGLA